MTAPRSHRRENRRNTPGARILPDRGGDARRSPRRIRSAVVERRRTIRLRPAGRPRFVLRGAPIARCPGSIAYASRLQRGCVRRNSQQIGQCNLHRCREGQVIVGNQLQRSERLSLSVRWSADPNPRELVVRQARGFGEAAEGEGEGIAPGQGGALAVQRKGKEHFVGDDRHLEPGDRILFGPVTKEPVGLLGFTTMIPRVRGVSDARMEFASISQRA